MKKLMLLSFIGLVAFECLCAQDIILPKAQTKGGMPLMEALNQRKSTREFGDKEIELQILSNLLWAANGFNRIEDMKRTVPSSMNYQEMEVYVANKDGLYRYVAKKHTLIKIHSNDIRAKTGKQDFVATAPVNLIFVANSSKLPEQVNLDDHLKESYANTGFIAQNVYLFCASEGLNVVVRGYFEEAELSKAMRLPKSHKIILTQSVGYPPNKQ